MEHPGQALSGGFDVPDRTAALALVRDLVLSGFPLVIARPVGDHWTVEACDGPYPPGELGRRTGEGVREVATRLAERYGGRPARSTWLEAAVLAQRLAQPGTLPRGPETIVHADPGSRPAMPTVVLRVPPPRAVLTVPADPAVAGAVDVSDLDTVDWANLPHGLGNGDDVPRLIRELARRQLDWEEVAYELPEVVTYAGGCYPATAPAVPFLARVARSHARPGALRLYLYGWLLFLAGRLAEGLLADASRASAAGTAPQAPPHTEDVHHAVGIQLPDLLSQWDNEPAAVRFALACLTALYPNAVDRDGPVATAIATLATEHADTQHGDYLQLASALLHGDEDRAMALAYDIACWEENAEPHWLVAPAVPAPVRAGHVLADGALRLI